MNTRALRPRTGPDVDGTSRAHLTDGKVAYFQRWTTPGNWAVYTDSSPVAFQEISATGQVPPHGGVVCGVGLPPGDTFGRTLALYTRCVTCGVPGKQRCRADVRRELAVVYGFGLPSGDTDARRAPRTACAIARQGGCIGMGDRGDAQRRVLQGRTYRHW